MQTDILSEDQPRQEIPGSRSGALWTLVPEACTAQSQ